MKTLRFGLWGAVIVAAFLFGLFAYQLSQPKEETVRSALVGQTIPDFDLPPISESRPGLSSADLADGEAKLLNIFASWCIPCAVEAPALEELEQQGALIVAVAISDTSEGAERFLVQHGNPFARIGDDAIAQVQLGLGSGGVPETFVIDGEGVITYQHIGVIGPQDVPVLMEELAKAGGSGG
jgi:cytochrome c biogenesis protein CcmG/thiol:disulfide interchange protein DsbE